MAELKTRQNNKSVRQFIDGVEDKKKREDCKVILKLMEEVTKSKPKMWGDSIVGFGNYHYEYESGREGDWFLTGFSPRKQNLTLYIMSGFKEHSELLKNLGKYKTSKACLYINKIEDINLDILKKMISKSVERLVENYP